MSKEAVHFQDPSPFGIMLDGDYREFLAFPTKEAADAAYASIVAANIRGLTVVKLY